MLTVGGPDWDPGCDSRSLETAGADVDESLMKVMWGFWMNIN